MDWTRYWRIVSGAVRHFNNDDGWAMASHVALSSLMALFPFLIFATSLASFLGAHAFAETAVHLIFDTWPSRVADPISREVMDVLTVNRGGLLTISVAAAFFFASNGVEALRVALNRAYRVSDTRSIFFTRAQSLGFVLVATVLMMAISFLLVLAPLAETLLAKYVPAAGKLIALIKDWRLIIAAAVLLIGLIVSHKWLPAGKRSIFSILPGIVVTFVLWIVSSMIFAAYLKTFANYFSTYAGLTSLMIALIFLYIIGAIFILGAELNASIIIEAREDERRNS
ncbi:YihY/virulence factor BrkB family protein [Hoeflea sp. CAU 1731]